jgi:thiamine kinase-like enzyme
MDPLSIAILAAKGAKTLFNASETIYQFVQTTRDVDRAISGLLSQIKGLAQLLTAISSALQLPAMQSACKDHRDLWDQVGNSVNAAGETVERLRHEIKPLEKAGSNSLKQA